MQRVYSFFRSRGHIKSRFSECEPWGMRPATYLAAQNGNIVKAPLRHDSSSSSSSSRRRSTSPYVPCTVTVTAAVAALLGNKKFSWEMRGRRPSQANIVNLDCIAWEAGNDEISWMLTYARRLVCASAAPRSSSTSAAAQPALLRGSDTQEWYLFSPFFLSLYILYFDLTHTVAAAARTFARHRLTFHPWKALNRVAMRYEHRKFNGHALQISVKLITECTVNSQHRKKLKNTTSLQWKLDEKIR